MLDFDENPISTMFREIKEETGLNFYKQIKKYFFSADSCEGDSIFEDSKLFTSWVGAK
jgi:8-oxo-dGTP pyrophosphatase MutT (NUDIX family)